MKWLWITALFFLVTGVKSGPARIDGVLVEWTIAKIERTDMGNAGASDKFRFTLSGKKDSDITWILLDVDQDGKTQVPVNATNIKDPQAPTFETNLKQYSGNNATFVINAFNNAGDLKAGAYADLNPFPNFPGNTSTQNLFDPRDLAKKNILLRVDGSLGDMRPQEGEPLIIGDINYFAFLDNDSVDYVPWYNSSGVDVCDKELDHSETTGTVIEPTVYSAVLAYGPNNSNATIKLSFLNTKAIHDVILIPQPPKSPERNVLCTQKQFNDADCTIDWSDQGYEVLQLITIQVPPVTAPDAVAWATYSFDILDRELVATNLGETILEGRWKMLTNETKTYLLTKTNDTDKTTNSIRVDCSNLEEMCFGYFPHMTKGKYTLTVAPETKNGNLNQIESHPVDFSAPQPKLEILSRHTTTHRNQQKADVQICFQHLTPTEGRSFSHYEMLIINEKGQWLKHRIMQEEEEEEEGDANEERLCFAPFTISTKDFDLTEGTKVVVSQRAVDGVSVLASGESALF